MQHLYLHIPFCVRRCSYCDFSIAVRKRIPVQEYVDSVLKELSSADPGPAARGEREITLEANPEDVTPDHARAWRAAGINRVSLGAQSFDDNVLKWMHRSHDAARIGA